MNNVKVICNYCSDETIFKSMKRRSCPSFEDGIWGSLKLTQNDDWDYLVIINYPLVPLTNKKKTIIFPTEPTYHRKNWGEYEHPNKNEYFYVFDVENHCMAPLWSLMKPYSWLISQPIEKTKLLSTIISNNNVWPGHKQRVKFLSYLAQIPGFDHYGRGAEFFKDSRSYRGPLEDKDDGLLPYKYTFNCENVYERNGFTEKIIDAIVSECLCFYYGCENVGDFIDPRCYIYLDMNDMDKSIATIKEAIANNEWEKRLPIIQKEKKRILNELHILPMIDNVINGRPWYNYRGQN